VAPGVFDEHMRGVQRGATAAEPTRPDRIISEPGVNHGDGTPNGGPNGDGGMHDIGARAMPTRAIAPPSPMSRGSCGTTRRCTPKCSSPGGRNPSRRTRAAT